MADPELKITMIPTQKADPVTNDIKQKTVTSKRKPSHHNHWVIGLLGTGGVFLWITFFSLGMLVDSTQYRVTLTTNFSVYKFIMTMITFTPSNIAILCLISAFTGGCGSLMVIKKAQKALGLDDPNSKINSHIYMTENPFSSMLRGILVFFAFLAGVFITSSTALSQPTPQSYTQAAGIVSMIAFVVGYDPSVFFSLLNIAGKIKTKAADNEE